MTEEERKKYMDALKRASLGPQGPMGPNGPVSPVTGTISSPKPKSNFQKIKDAAYGVLPQGAYGVGQTVGPLATQINPVPSLKRTFTLENARGYANPNSGWDWKRRLLGAGEDALNVVGVGSIAKSAVVDPLINNTYVFGKTLVHGSPTEITGGFVEPRLGSAVLPKEEIAFAYNPSAFKHWGKNMPTEILDSARSHAGNSGNIYVTKAKRNQISNLWDQPGSDIVYTSGPQKIVSKINLPGIGSTSYSPAYADTISEFAQALARNGVRRPIPKPNIFNKFKVVPQEDSPV